MEQVILAKKTLRELSRGLKNAKDQKRKLTVHEL